MDAPRKLHLTAGLTGLVFALAIAGTAVIAPLGRSAASAAYDFTGVFVDPEPNPVVTPYNDHE